MISVKRMFVAGVVSLCIVLSSSCTGRMALPAPGGCDKPVCDQGLTAHLQTMSKLGILNLSISNDEITTNINNDDYQSVMAAIRQYISLHPECYCLNTYILTVNKCTSLNACTLKYKGTVLDQGNNPRIVIEAKIIERTISAVAIRSGVKTKGLRVRLKKDNKGNQFLLVSGEVSVLKGSASQGKQIVIDALKVYYPGLNIDTTNLKERYEQR